jgi:hypothetical protein
MKIRDVKVGAIVQRGEYIYILREIDSNWGSAISSEDNFYTWDLLRMDHREENWNRAELFYKKDLDLTMEEHNQKKHPTRKDYWLKLIAMNEKQLIMK